MVLSQEKIIFIHIPKTGGSSIEEYLLNQFGYKRGYFTLTNGLYKSLNYNRKEFTIYPSMHSTLDVIEIMLKHINIKIDNSWKIFSIVRNPYNRFISELFYTPNLPMLWHYHTLSESDKKHLVNITIDLYFENDPAGNNHSNHSIPQYQFFEGTELNCEIFKYEEGFKNILTKLGLYKGDEIPRFLDVFKVHDIPKVKPYEKVYTRKLIQCINEKYEKDFEKYGYQMLDPLMFD
jgi:hypothetical protein